MALFATCYVNYNDPAIAKAAVDVLEKAGCDVECPEQVCCGMPKIDGGDLEGARALARRNVETLLPAVRAGRKIVTPGPSCTLMLRTEYPELVPTAEGREVAAAVMDLSDFVLQQARAKKLPKPAPGAVGKVAYHVACHNRVQNFGYRGRDLLKWAGGDVTTFQVGDVHRMALDGPLDQQFMGGIIDKHIKEKGTRYWAIWTERGRE